MGMKDMIIVALSLMLAFPTTDGVKGQHETRLHFLTLLVSVSASQSLKGVLNLAAKFSDLNSRSSVNKAWLKNSLALYCERNIDWY